MDWWCKGHWHLRYAADQSMQKLGVVDPRMAEDKTCTTKLHGFAFALYVNVMQVLSNFMLSWHMFHNLVAVQGQNTDTQPKRGDALTEHRGGGAWCSLAVRMGQQWAQDIDHIAESGNCGENATIVDACKSAKGQQSSASPEANNGASISWHNRH